MDNHWIGTQNDDDDIDGETRRPPRLVRNNSRLLRRQRERDERTINESAKTCDCKTERRRALLSHRDGTGKFVVGGNWNARTIDSIDKLCASLNSGKITADVEVIARRRWYT